MFRVGTDEKQERKHQQYCNKVKITTPEKFFLSLDIVAATHNQ
jgi:hypothetical protein